MAVNYDFTGSNGDALPAGWTTMGSNTAPDIQSNRGQADVGEGAWVDTGESGDRDISFDILQAFTVPTTSAWGTITYAGTSTSTASGFNRSLEDSHYLQGFFGDLTFLRRTAGSSTSEGSTSGFGAANNDVVHVLIQIRSGVASIYLWKNAGSQPGSPQVTVTLVFDGPYFAFSGAATGWIDNLVVVAVSATNANAGVASVTASAFDPSGPGGSGGIAGLASVVATGFDAEVTTTTPGPGSGGELSVLGDKVSPTFYVQPMIIDYPDGGATPAVGDLILVAAIARHPGIGVVEQVFPTITMDTAGFTAGPTTTVQQPNDNAIIPPGNITPPAQPDTYTTIATWWKIADGSEAGTSVTISRDDEALGSARLFVIRGALLESDPLSEYAIGVHLLPYGPGVSDQAYAPELPATTTGAGAYVGFIWDLLDSQHTTDGWTPDPEITLYGMSGSGEMYGWFSAQGGAGAPPTINILTIPATPPELNYPPPSIHAAYVTFWINSAPDGAAFTWLQSIPRDVYVVTALGFRYILQEGLIDMNPATSMRFMSHIGYTYGPSARVCVYVRATLDAGVATFQLSSDDRQTSIFSMDVDATTSGLLVINWTPGWATGDTSENLYVDITYACDNSSARLLPVVESFLVAATSVLGAPSSAGDFTFTPAGYYTGAVT